MKITPEAVTVVTTKGYDYNNNSIKCYYLCFSSFCIIFIIS